MWTYSWADFCRSSASWILTTASIGPAFKRVSGRPVGGHADLGEDQLEVFLVDRLPDEILDRLDPFFGLLDARAALGPDVHLERARVDLGEEIAAHDRPHHGQR